MSRIVDITAKVLGIAVACVLLLAFGANAHHSTDTAGTLGGWFHYTLDVRSGERREEARQEILRWFDGQLDGLYAYHGYGKLAKWDVRRWRRFELRELPFHELLKFFGHIKHQEWGYHASLYSVREYAEQVFGPLQWREAQWRPTHHAKNESFITNTPGVLVYTGAESYREFYPDFRSTRNRLMHDELREGARWIGKNWIDYTWSKETFGRNEYLHAADEETIFHANRLGFDSGRLRLYFGDALAVEHLEWHGHLTRAERILHYHADVTLAELFE